MELVFMFFKSSQVFLLPTLGDKHCSNTLGQLFLIEEMLKVTLLHFLRDKW